MINDMFHSACLPPATFVAFVFAYKFNVFIIGSVIKRIWIILCVYLIWLCYVRVSRSFINFNENLMFWISFDLFSRSHTASRPTHLHHYAELPHRTGGLHRITAPYCPTNLPYIGCCQQRPLNLISICFILEDNDYYKG